MVRFDLEGGKETVREAPNASLRVLHVLASGPYGGLESVVRALCQGLLRSGHEPHVIAIVDGDGPPDAFETGLREAGVPVTVLRLGDRAYLRERRELVALGRRLKPDILHSHGYRADVQLISVGRKLGVPVVSTVHGFTGGNLKMGIYERLQEFSLRRAAGVAAVSRPIRERLQESGVDGARIRWIANAWETDRRPVPRDEARHVLGLDPTALVVGWVGRLSREKGADVLLEALPGLLPPGIGGVFCGRWSREEPTRCACRGTWHVHSCSFRRSCARRRASLFGIRPILSEF